ncbi:MAG: Maf family protein [Patescibacteria group bacterium]|nr:Maf family protein [Patescibacteria group bacterium]
MKLILGSSSKWRKEILENAGYKFDIMEADINEKAIRSDNYELLPLLIARAKAKPLLKKIKQPSILVTSDQVVVCEGELREKPKDTQEAQRFLESYSVHPVQSITAVVVTNTVTQEKVEGVDIAEVHFKKIPQKVIEKFIKDGIAFTCAGGFAVNHSLLKPFVERIDGNRDSVIGLPMGLTMKLLEESSYSS